MIRVCQWSTRRTCPTRPSVCRSGFNRSTRAPRRPFQLRAEPAPVRSDSLPDSAQPRAGRQVSWWRNIWQPTVHAVAGRRGIQQSESQNELRRAFSSQLCIHKRPRESADVCALARGVLRLHAHSSARILALICSNSASFNSPLVTMSFARCSRAIGEPSPSSLAPTPAGDRAPPPIIPRVAPI
jgi:hypothetical protein